MMPPDDHPATDQAAHPQLQPAAVASPAAARPKELWQSEELLGDRCEILIQHGNELYRLRRTRQGKLILHK